MQEDLVQPPLLPDRTVTSDGGRLVRKLVSMDLVLIARSRQHERAEFEVLGGERADATSLQSIFSETRREITADEPTSPILDH
jgi:hypothetical protein